MHIKLVRLNRLSKVAENINKERKEFFEFLKEELKDTVFKNL
ncbi:MAG: hypothetical protein P4L22_04465 [Candidatus Babeliales bacterium]|nr:hypothetical protein [Candidatus Babeliales bacterium]